MECLGCNAPYTLINYPLSELHSGMHFLLCDKKVRMLLVVIHDDDVVVDVVDETVGDDDDDANALLVY